MLSVATVSLAQPHPGNAPLLTAPTGEGYLSPPTGTPPPMAHTGVGPMPNLGPTDPFVTCGAVPNGGPWETGPSPRPWLMRQMDLRHSSTHGRAMGPGEPLRGTSWRNRPFAVSLDGGGLFMGDRVAANVRANNDLFGAIGVGWDLDHYWGTQVRVGWSTPTLLNTLQTSLPTDDNLFITDLSLLYYPWGDSRLRPYYRFGVGLTDIEYTNDNGLGQHEMLFTLPLAVGLKYQQNRHMAWRLEFADSIAFGQNESSTLNNFTISAGVEWRFGGTPSGYWAWAPRAGGW
ncbi:MAG: outer membrane beta-barrel protein [Planctomycetota bacterium]